MSESKKAKYFCENCGAEVNANARFCPNCGKFFAAVRCPRCSYTGTIKDFKTGCPRCHYAMSKDELYGTENFETSFSSSDGKKHKLSRKSKKLIKKSFAVHQNKKNISSDSPTWLLIISILAVIFLVAIIFLKCNEGF